MKTSVASQWIGYCAALAALVYAPMSAASILDDAASFNVIAFGDFNASSNFVQGALGVGGNASLDSYAVNTEGASGYGLIVEGDLRMGAGGGTVYGTVGVQGTVSGNGTYPGGVGKTGANPVLGQAAQTSAAAYADQLSTLAATGTAVSKWGGAYFTGDGRSALQVFNLDGALLGTAGYLDVSGLAAGSTVLFNVGGSQASLNPGLDLGASFAGKVLFNFYDADTLSFRNLALKASVLAPTADLYGASGAINGQVIVDNFSGSLTFNRQAFNGSLPFQLSAVSAIPEPGTWALMLAGLGVAGLGLRKQRRRSRD